MKNLKLRRTKQLASPSRIDGDPILITVHLDVSYVFYVTADGSYLRWFNENGDHGELSINEEIDDPTDHHHIIIGMANVAGCLLLLRPHCRVLRIESFFDNPTISRETVELPNNLEITDMTWNYAGDKAILSTSDVRTAFVATPYFQLLCAVDLSDEQTVPRPSVGWGQKATQFKGYRKKTSETRQNANHTISSDDDDNTVYVAWRKDGALFAVNWSHPDTGERRIKIFTGEGTLKYISEDNGTLDGPIAWKPSMGFIGGVQVIAEDSRQICLLEQNALYHCCFELPASYKVKQLRWNCNSDILAVCCLNNKLNTIDVDEEQLLLLEEEEKQRNLKTSEDWCIFVWVNSNCKWYLKQCLHFEEPVWQITWDSDKPYRLHVVCSSMYRFYEWNWQYDVSYPCYCSSDRYNSSALIASINGSSLEFATPMKAIIPPPLFAHSIELHDYADDVIFPQNCCRQMKCTMFAVVSRNRLLRIFNYDGIEFRNVANYRLKFPPDTNDDGVSSHWHWYLPRTIFFQRHNKTGIFLCRVMVDDNFNFGNGSSSSSPSCWINLPVVRLPLLSAAVSSITNNSFSSNGLLLLVSLFDSSLLLYRDDKDGGDNYNMKIIRIGSVYVKMELTEFGLIGLSDEGRLVVANTVVVVDEKVTWFVWSAPYLLYTTTDYILVCCHLLHSNNKDALEKKTAFRVMDRRQLEQTNRLVALVGSTVILQHSRGNLETIVPRPFVLSYLHRMLKHRRYYEAFFFLRSVRVSYNMLVDANPRMFLRDINTFLDRTMNNQQVDLLKAFVDDVEPKSYALTVYRDYYRHYYPQVAELKNKFSKLLNVLVNSMMNGNNNNYNDEVSWQIILTCLVRLNRLQEALKHAKDRNLLSFLLKLTNGRNLFQAALSNFDLDVALTVAKMAQLESEDYRSTLDRLKLMTDNRRRFTILKMAGNYKEALRYLLIDDSSSTDYPEFIRQHNLYADAVTLSKGTDKHETVRLMYAGHLFQTNSYQDAALIYESAGQYEKAFEAFLLAEKWDECLSIEHKLNKRNDVIRTVVDGCYSARNLIKAAEITLNRLHDPDGSIRLYLEAEKFEEALNVALSSSSSSRERDIAERFKPSLAVAYSRLWKSIARHIDTIVKHSSRLKTIKEDRMKKQQEEETTMNLADEDFYSREPSIIGSSSGRSNLSTASSKRTEKRLWNLKEGNPREELALYKSLRSELEELYKLTDETRSVCLVMSRLGDVDLASKLQKHLKSAISRAEEIKSILWKCSTADLLHKYEDILVRCSPLRLTPKTTWEIPLLNNYN